MKNAILYYYNFNDIYINKIDNENYVTNKENGKIYLFSEVKNLDECMEAIKITSNSTYFNKVITNIQNSFFTPYNGRMYILQEKNNIKINVIDSLESRISFSKNSSSLDRNNWKELWSRKIDYYEYQLEHLKNKYKIINETIDYYIGLTENAISMYNYAIATPSKVSTPQYLCHRRITSDSSNVLNVVLDCKEREIAEYLKKIFWDNKYSLKEVQVIINKFSLSEKECYFLYSRLLYPNYYFDIYDQILNSEKKETDLVKIVERSKEYELFLDNISKILSKGGKIKLLNWIKKNK